MTTSVPKLKRVEAEARERDIATLIITREDDSVLRIRLAFDDLPKLYLSIEQAASDLRRQMQERLGGFDPRLFYQSRVRSLTDSRAVRGESGPLLLLELAGSLELVLHPQGEQLETLRRAVEAISRAADQTPPASSATRH